MSILDPRLWLCAIIGLAVSFFTGYGSGLMHASKTQKIEAAKAATASAKAEAAQEKVTARVGDQAAQAQASIQTIFRDRIIYRDREVPREVIVREDAACRIPGRFVGMWNSANRAELPTTASLLDEAASGVALSDVEAQHEREAEAFHANAQQLTDLQEWVRRQAEIAVKTSTKDM